MIITTTKMRVNYSYLIDQKIVCLSIIRFETYYLIEFRVVLLIIVAYIISVENVGYSPRC